MVSQIADVRGEVAHSHSEVTVLKRHVDSSLQRLIKQMNAGFAAVNGSRPAAKSDPPQPDFSNEYPKNKGVVHTVEKGETVSSIAKKHNSKVTWIINANQVSDATKVHVGKELFVPQEYW